MPLFKKTSASHRSAAASRRGRRRWSPFSFDLDLSTIVLDADRVEADLAEGFARGPHQRPASRLRPWLRWETN